MRLINSVLLKSTIYNYETGMTLVDKPTYVLFTSKSCQLCKTVKQNVLILEKKYKDKVDFCELNIDRSPTASNGMGIEYIPYSFATSKRDDPDPWRITGNPPLTELTNVIEEIINMA